MKDSIYVCELIYGEKFDESSQKVKEEEEIENKQWKILFLSACDSLFFNYIVIFSLLIKLGSSENRTRNLSYPKKNHATRPKAFNKYALFCSYTMLLSLPFDSKELSPFNAASLLQMSVCFFPSKIIIVCNQKHKI